MIPAARDEAVPGGTYGSCVVTIEKEVYVFGGQIHNGPDTNLMWKLITSQQQLYAWTTIKTGTMQNTPSPRAYHSGWEFSGKLWTFGGNGCPLEGYLNDNGEWNDGPNNQVLCFDPSSQKWTNPKCNGTAPCPRLGHASTIVGDHVWMFGGTNFDFYLNDLYQFDLISLTWTEIQTSLAKPVQRQFCSLNAVSEHQIVLHGGLSESSGSDKKQNDTWVFDLQSLSWKQHAANKKFTWCNHTGNTSLDRSVIVIGGLNKCCSDDNDDNVNDYDDYDYSNDDDDDDYADDDDDDDDDGDDYDDDCRNDTCDCAQAVTIIRLEPKSLQQFAIWTISQNQSELPWESCLPKSLIARFLLS